MIRSLCEFVGLLSPVTFPDHEKAREDVKEHNNRAREIMKSMLERANDPESSESIRDISTNEEY